MSRPLKGIYKIQNPDKYTGEYPIIYRSSWEHEFMVYCDNHPDVVEWASEPVSIPYKDPTRERKQSLYVPDFLVTIINKSKETTTKLIEIKPMAEALTEHARTNKDAVVKMKNDAKWAAAQAWSMRRGIDFQVMHEGDMFHGHANRPGRKNPIRPVIPAQVKKLTPKRPSASSAKKALGSLSRRGKPTAGKIKAAAKAAKAKKIRKARKS